LRAALNTLAVEAPKWLKVMPDPEWFKRYGSRIENFNLPKTDTARAQLASEIAA